MIYGLTYNSACCCFWEFFLLTQFTQFLNPNPWQLYPRSPPRASDSFTLELRILSRAKFNLSSFSLHSAI